MSVRRRRPYVRKDVRPGGHSMAVEYAIPVTRR
jgi:hypothetical protein